MEIAMRTSEAMTTEVRAIAPDRTIRDAARLMDELNVGALPVCLDGQLVGILTDRDITVRSTAAGTAPGEQTVQEIMTADPISCTPDDDTTDVLRRMSELQVRRMPVLGGDGQLVGTISLGDLAADGAPGAGEALQRISTPAEPDLTGTPSTARADATRDQRPSPLSDEERRELEERLGHPESLRGDAGRAPDPGAPSAEGGLVFTDNESVRAAVGSFGNPVGADGDQHMRGGFGGDGYANCGETFGPGAIETSPVPMTDAADLERTDSIIGDLPGKPNEGSAGGA